MAYSCILIRLRHNTVFSHWTVNTVRVSLWLTKKIHLRRERDRHQCASLATPLFYGTVEVLWRWEWGDVSPFIRLASLGASKAFPLGSAAESLAAENDLEHSGHKHFMASGVCMTYNLFREAIESTKLLYSGHLRLASRSIGGGDRPYSFWGNGEFPSKYAWHKHHCSYVTCARLRWPSRQPLSAHKYIVSYRSDYATSDWSFWMRPGRQR